MFQFITNEQNRWLRRSLGVVLVVIFLLKFLLGTLLGLLLFSWLLYLGLPHFTGIEPWSAAQLVLWFDELGNDAKIGLTSSLITVLGFFIALHSTMHSWQRQTAASMRMSAADAIDQVLSEANAVLLNIALFTSAIAKEVERVRSQDVSLEATTMLSVLSDNLVSFREDRQRLIHLEQEIIELPAHYAVHFLPLSGIPSALDAIEEHISSVTKKVWVQAPAVSSVHPDHIRHLVECVDPVKYSDLSRASTMARDKIAGLKGGIRGTLLSPILEANPVSFLRIVQHMFK